MNDKLIRLQYMSQIEAAKEAKLPSIYTDPKSVDAWLHLRKYETLLPLIESYPKSNWLTIGDGRYGSDAHYLISQGIKTTSSNITDEKLKIAKERNYISSYRIENAENLKCEEDDFDFVLCKESYHHFPRPPIAFYEMLRVAKTALILLEPIEGEKKTFDFFRKSFFKNMIRGDETALFEKSGNYIYRTSIREIIKMMAAINGKIIAVKYHNSFFHPKFANQKQNGSLGSFITRIIIGLQDLFCKFSLMNYGLATIIIFKQNIDNFAEKELIKKGFKLIEIPKNPYLED